MRSSDCVVTKFDEEAEGGGRGLKSRSVPPPSVGVYGRKGGRLLPRSESEDNPTLD